MEKYPRKENQRKTAILKERIERNGIRHDHLAKMFSCSQAYFSMCVNGLRPMPDEMRYILENYLQKIEVVNMNNHTEALNLLFKDVFEAVEEVLGVTQEQLKSKDRKREYVRGREMFSFHAYSFIDCSLTMIAKVLNKQQHCTIIHSIRNHENFYSVENEYREQSDEIKMLLDAKKV